VSQVRYSNNLIVWITINNVPARALIDSGCIGNFLSPQFTKKHSIVTRRKNEPFLLIAINRKPVTYNKGIVIYETSRLPL
jgi:hypothetical protein